MKEDQSNRELQEERLEQIKKSLLRKGYSAAAISLLFLATSGCNLEDLLNKDDDKIECEDDDEGCLCEDTADTAEDDTCDDGGEDSENATTSLGTNCQDCGIRHEGDEYSYSDSGSSYSNGYSDGYYDYSSDDYYEYSDSYYNYYYEYYYNSIWSDSW